MRWFVTIPGQPVSLDDAYPIGTMPVKRRGAPVLGPDGKQKYIHRPVLSSAAETWRNDVQLLVQNARPSRWKPAGQIRILLDLHLTRDMDADNTLKLVLDGIALGIGYNDRNFLPCVRSKEHGLQLRDARVEITVDDDITHPC